jgi:hypothetical protein
MKLQMTSQKKYNEICLNLSSLLSNLNWRKYYNYNQRLANFLVIVITIIGGSFFVFLLGELLVFSIFNHATHYIEILKSDIYIISLIHSNEYISIPFIISLLVRSILTFLIVYKMTKFLLASTMTRVIINNDRVLAPSLTKRVLLISCR